MLIASWLLAYVRYALATFLVKSETGPFALAIIFPNASMLPARAFNLPRSILGVKIPEVLGYRDGAYPLSTALFSF